MYDTEDTIVAIATPPGEGALGIIRISGSLALSVISGIFVKSPPKNRRTVRFQPRKALLGFIRDEGDSALDQVLATYFPGPNSFSGEDMVEVSGHGNFFILNQIVELIISKGARLAQPGEFTLRAFLNDRIDLPQAEAVADLIRAKTKTSLELSLNQMAGKLSAEIQKIQDNLKSVYARYVMDIDFPEEDVPDLDNNMILSRLIDCQKELIELINSVSSSLIIRDGIITPIVGIPNVGKSSLMNLLLKNERVIVSPTPGTTRDSIEEFYSMGGHLFKLVDTAGIRDTSNPVEQEGVRRTFEIVKNAQFLIILLEPLTIISDIEKKFLEKTAHIPRSIAFNKIDLVDPKQLPDNYLDEPITKMSIKLNEGIDQLKDRISGQINKNYSEIEHDQNSAPRLTNFRQKRACQKALQALERGIDGLRQCQLSELIAFEIEECIHSLNEIVGKTTGQDILHQIFSQFCIGK